MLIPNLDGRAPARRARRKAGARNPYSLWNVGVTALRAAALSCAHATRLTSAGASCLSPPHPQVTHCVTGPRDICIASFNMPGEGFAQTSAANHAAYAARHGYQAYRFEDRVSGEDFVNPRHRSRTTRFGGGLTWQKLTVLQLVANLTDGAGAPRCAWMMWLDSDALFTNTARALEDIVDAYATSASTHVILSREESNMRGNFVNSGAFFVRNSAPGLDFVRRVGALYHKYKDGPLTDQNAVHEVAFAQDPRGLTPADRDWLEARLRPDIVIAPQQTFNSFYWPWPPASAAKSALWKKCDFVAHLAGHDARARVRLMRRIAPQIDACEAEAS